MKDSFLESQNSGWATQCTVTTLLKMTIERKLWGGVMHMGELSFPLVHAFQANIWTKRNPRDPPLTRNHSPTDQTISPLLFTRDSMGLDHELQRQYLVLLDFLMAFVGNMNIHLAAYHLVLLGSFFLLYILWPVGILPLAWSRSSSFLFIIIIIIIHFFFLPFGTLGFHGPS